jgi:ubiquinone/menaquinone biosynthesis C-methylase UbiE
MNVELEDVHRYVPGDVANDEMNWHAYAEHYDQMCKFNPPYQDNIDTLIRYLSEWSLPSNADICDLGAGTGNYILEVAKSFPDVHIDFDSKMNELANKKYAAAGVDKVSIVTEYAQQCTFPKNRFDLVICVNALYAISPQEDVLRKVRSWLRPDGWFFIIDFGRKQRTLEWTLFLFRQSLKAHRAGEYVKALLDAREVLKQNRKSTKGQESGRYWLHSTDAFGKTLSECGFDVEEIFPCYRGYADLAICRKTT